MKKEVGLDSDNPMRITNTPPLNLKYQAGFTRT